MQSTRPGLELALEFIDSRLRYIQTFTKTVDCDRPMSSKLAAAEMTLNQLRSQIVRAIGPTP